MGVTATREPTRIYLKGQKMNKDMYHKLADHAYIAGLFDGEGCVQYKKALTCKRKNNKRYKTQIITLEMSMTDEAIIRWVHETLGVGTVVLNIKNKSPSSKPHWKDQWRWRCHNRGAYKVAKIFWPFAQVKLHQLEQIIDHYEPEHAAPNVVSLEAYRNE